MSYLQIEQLQRENTKYVSKLRQVQTDLVCLRNDYTAATSLLASQKEQLKQCREELKQLKGRLGQRDRERDSIEEDYRVDLKQLRDQLEEAKKKYARLENKILPLLDQDTVRLKILNEVEGSHGMEIDGLRRINEALRDENNRLKREVQLGRHRLENMQLQHQDQLRRAKKEELVDNIALTEVNRDFYSILKESEQQARKEAEYYKGKYFAEERRQQQQRGKIPRSVKIFQKNQEQ